MGTLELKASREAGEQRANSVYARDRGARASTESNATASRKPRAADAPHARQALCEAEEGALQVEQGHVKL